MAKTNKKLLATLRDSEASTSIIFGAIVVIVLGLLIFNFVNNNRSSQVTDKGITTEQQPVGPNEIGYVPPTQLPAEHTVVAGEHLWGIAEKYYGSGYNYVDVAKGNNLDQEAGLEIGQKLNIPAIAARQATVENIVKPLEMGAAEISAVIPLTGDTYNVLTGDNLWNIALRAYGDAYKWMTIYNANKDLIKDPNSIEIGWTLKIPR